MSYTLRVTTSDPSLLRQPSLNVSHSGRIPEGSEVTWRVAMPCRHNDLPDEEDVQELVLVSVAVTVEDPGLGTTTTYNMR